MSHVDEGALHAYLDGALDELPSGRGRAIREHVATCPECAARLEEERRIREQAMAILSSPLPQVELPPLEELRLRAEATSPPKASRGRRFHRMGWAASVILAIGAGWTLRGGQAVPLGTMDLIDGPSRLPQLEAAPTVPDLDASARDLLTQALDGSDRGADPDESLVAEADSGDPLVMEPGRPVLFQELAAIDVVTLQDRLGSAPALPPLEASGLVDLLRSSAATVRRLEGVLAAPRPVAVRGEGGVPAHRRQARRHRGAGRCTREPGRAGRRHAPGTRRPRDHRRQCSGAPRPKRGTSLERRPPLPCATRRASGRARRLHRRLSTRRTRRESGG